jgi:hypothetical protein
MREVTWGTPRRSPRYQALRRSGLLPLALLLGGLVAGLFFAAQAVGARSALSPGSISSPHAPMAGSCAECHADRAGVASARCERCHDPAGATNLSHEAHASARKRAPSSTGPEPELACDRCHREHEGRDARIAVVSSAECARCHFRSFASHPEFAVVREKRGERPGLRFDHASHIRTLMDAKGGAGSAVCTRCHEPSPENRDFLPIAFETHCAGCHEQAGSLGISEGVDAGHVSAPPPGEARLERGRITKTRVPHRDSWIVANWHALRRRLDPAGFRAEAEPLRVRRAQLQQRLSRIGQAAPGSQPPPPVLTLGARKQLERAIAESDGQLRVLSGEASGGEPPLPPSEQRSARMALQAVTAPCRNCHVPDPAGAFVPVRAARHVLTGAAFVHTPHLLYADCLRCHAGVAQSKSADELHLEGIQTCRGCHGGAEGVREDCQNCHRYHPKAAW